VFVDVLKKIQQTAYVSTNVTAGTAV